MRSFKRGYFYFRIPAHPLITCTALVPPQNRQQREASETACSLSDIRRASAETNANEILSGGLAVSQGRVMH